MAKVLAVLTKLSTESDRQFRERCGLFLLSEAYGSPAPGAIAVSRMTLSSDPMGLRPDSRWGLAFDGDPLPSETCFVSSFPKDEERLDLHPFDVADLDHAPVNPGVLPQAVHRMALREFCAQATGKRLVVDHDWEVFLDGRSLGFSAGLTLSDALTAAHAREVVLACSAALSQDGIRGLVLPSPEALGSHPNSLAGVAFEPIKALVHQPLRWTSEFSELAHKEGWDVFECEGRLEIQRYDGIDALPDDSTACAMVWEGVGKHHLFARTLLYEVSPFSYALMRQSASRPAEAPSAVRREAQGA